MLRSVGRLIVVAAPSCCGKTVFLAHLSRGAIPGIAAAVGIADPAEWRICDAVQLPRLPEDHVENLIVAYAIPAYEVVSGRLTDPAGDGRLEIVSLAREAAFVTLLTSPATLVSRLAARRRSNRKWLLLKPRKYLRARRLMNRLLPVYRDAAQVRAVYEWWFAYTASAGGRGDWVVDADAPYTLKGRFRREESERDRGVWISNAEARYELYPGAAWRDVLDRMSPAREGTEGMARHA